MCLLCEGQQHHQREAPGREGKVRTPPAWTFHSAPHLPLHTNSLDGGTSHTFQEVKCWHDSIHEKTFGESHPEKIQQGSEKSMTTKKKMKTIYKNSYQDKINVQQVLIRVHLRLLCGDSRSLRHLNGTQIEHVGVIIDPRCTRQKVQ